MSEVTGKWTFRLAGPSDAPAFGKWVDENPLIDKQDVADALSNPTTLYFVVCCDEVPITFAPCYAQLHLAHLGFNPDADGEMRKQALSRLMNWVGAFAVQMGIRSITTLTEEKYPVAIWAKRHGFKREPRQLFKWNLGDWIKGK